ncbi:phospholipase A and acyltransferase 3-like [Solea solea]|uniref:phospholipase A and acyltransferase 3-like n=1 Tax=Solea solea TaxID=90069 RepID=UPI00272B0849|nr:phospholipase A and acyltransferase 3-like [Solea solea]
MAQEQFDRKVKPGDLIEIDRGIYQHWAVYVGGNEVVHLVTADNGSLELLSNTSTAEVRRDKLQEVVGCNKFIIKNLLDDQYEPREPDVIVQDACGMVGRSSRYNLATSNCEHFVTNLRYGKPESRQVKNTATAIGGVAVGVGVAALAVLGAFLFSGSSEKEKEEEEEEERVNRTRQRNSRGSGNRPQHYYY